MSLPLTLVRADLFVAAVASLREHDRPFVCPRTGKDRDLETAVIGNPLHVPIRGEFGDPQRGMLVQCWVRSGSPFRSRAAGRVPIMAVRRHIRL